uniref:Uncharacterized protein n=1 Tax=Anguilla anguilla TaxID=7936 RepID=A0A0E9T1S8_ANGAN
MVSSISMELVSPSILTSRHCRAESRSSIAGHDFIPCGSDCDTLIMWYCRAPNSIISSSVQSMSSSRTAHRACSYS